MWKATTFGGRVTERVPAIEGAGRMLHHGHPDPVLRAILEAVQVSA